MCFPITHRHIVETRIGNYTKKTQNDGVFYSVANRCFEFALSWLPNAKSDQKLLKNLSRPVSCQAKPQENNLRAHYTKNELY